MLKKFIDRPRIDRHVDQRIPSIKNIIKDPELIPEDKRTQGINQLVSDTVQLAQNTQLEINRVIDTILTDKPDTDYTQYLRGLWSPLELRANPKSRPVELTTAQVKIMERSAYENPDTRYRFLSELYRSRQMAQALEYGFEAVWSLVDWPDDNPLVRYMVYQAQRGLKDILGFTDSVRGLPGGFNTSVNSLIGHYLRQVLTGNNDSFKEDLKSTIGSLRTFDSTLKQTNANLQENWEVIQQDLKSAGGDPFWRSVKTAMIGIWTAEAVKNFHYVEDLLENIIGTDIGDSVSQSMLNRHVERGVIEVFGQLETYINEQHVRNLEMAELRTLSVHNAVQATAQGSSSTAIQGAIVKLSPLVDKPFEDAAKSFGTIRLNYE